MRIHTRYFVFTLLLCLFVSQLHSAPKGRNARRINSDAANLENVIGAYQDSLASYKQRLDSLTAANDSLQQQFQPDGRYFRLFSPLNFYHNVAGSKLSLGKDDADTLVNNALLNVYLQKPELVRTTDKELERRERPAGEEQSEAMLPKYSNMRSQVVKEDAGKEALEALQGNMVDMYVAKPNFWTFSGEYYLQFLQNYISPNWYKGGSNSYSMLGTVTLQYNYNNKQKVKWNNKLEMRLGFQSSKSDTVNTFKTMDDLIRYTSNIGLQAHKNWYYTAQIIANTQFAQGRKDNQRKVYSDFMSPFNLNVSLGMDYTVKTNNNKLKGNIHIAPIAYNLKYVDRLDLATNNGLEKDHHTLHDYGSQFTVELDWTPFDMFKWHARLYGYTTYHKYQMEWENTLTFTFNKYISTNLFLYPRFDDSAKRVDDYSYWQFKEYLSFGFRYSM